MFGAALNGAARASNRIVWTVRRAFPLRKEYNSKSIFMNTWVLLLLFPGFLASAPLPLGRVPPGKVLLVIEPHHDDHTTDYGMGGLIARFVDEGYKAYYVRASNDEKDGSHEPGENDIINLRESIAATKILG